MAIASRGAAPAEGWRLYVPKLFVVLRRGYGLSDLRADAVAGLTVAIVALPLSMALAIASGTTPDKGLVTAIVAGLLISLLGGSRVQVGGPTGAFVVVVFDVIQRHGYDGLVTATFMAGLMVVAAGLLRLGTYIKYIPHPVVIGFTAGIAVIIFSSQVGAFLGLELVDPPAELVGKWSAYAAHIGTTEPLAVLLGGGSLLLILAIRRFRPAWPVFLIVIVLGGTLSFALDLGVATIGSEFGTIPSSLPAPAWPDLAPARLLELLPSAATIAFLAAVESLLSAIVADGMTGGRHRSNCELVAQGIANSASALFGGLPATGAIARTATNIRAGARSPLAGVFHALFLLALMVVVAPLAIHVPMAALAAILFMVAWHMSDAPRVVELLRIAPVGDRVVLFVTFALTVLVDLTVAIEVGVVLAAIVFMHRMAEVVAIHGGEPILDADLDDFARRTEVDPLRQGLAPAIELYEVRGPLFFGAAGRLAPALDRAGGWPRVILLRLSQVPFVDSTGVAALEAFLDRCRHEGTSVVVTGFRRPVLRELVRFGLALRRRTGVVFLRNEERALAVARRLATPSASQDAADD